MKLLTTIALILTLTSCTTQAKYSDEIMYDIASILKDITQAIDGELKFGDTAGLTSHEIIDNATRSNADKLAKLPKLAKAAEISDYRILSEFQEDNVVMLICDGDIALMEDAGCNAAFDKSYWDTLQPNSCSIKLDAAEICSN
ncbi:hypothetical protein [Vibrio scophthalmi]|uniref:Lipoprotein n=1 Tax=Vibrio scophthalmi TaxID=45658 RepID=A0A1E3WFI2_9VIBR|nr:hypothetical protein [Vibrio scophthalmi]ODS04578.1 hypothetical protein VSF3289_03717 [Vibrio scophthalmi]